MRVTAKIIRWRFQLRAAWGGKSKSSRAMFENYKIQGRRIPLPPHLRDEDEGSSDALEGYCTGQEEVQGEESL
jgi:hypothetical protein